MEIDTKGWEVVEVCPECGLERTYNLDTWLNDQWCRKRRSYCNQTGKDVWMCYTGWRYNPDGALARLWENSSV